ncbi:MAG: hypothetical protein GKR98_01910 [Boseongicola sp.]|nr:MAG: hypothetical protein GKR98_01910 [Boseongicola sp.]
MFKTLISAVALSVVAGTAFADNYTITVTNNLDEELLAPILVTDAGNDAHIFDGAYVTAEAEEQILTGDPKMLAERIGGDMVAVGHGMDGPPGVLLAPGKSVTLNFKTDATALRVIAMVAPTMVADHYVSNVVDVHAQEKVAFDLNRFDIGHDEGTKMNMAVGSGAASVTIERAM